MGMQQWALSAMPLLLVLLGHSAEATTRPVAQPEHASILPNRGVRPRLDYPRQQRRQRNGLRRRLKQRRQQQLQRNRRRRL